MANDAKDKESSKPPRERKFVEKLAYHYLDRMEAAKIYFSGELDVRRKALLDEGDVPWRVIRYSRIVEPESLSYPIGKDRYVRPKTFDLHLKYFTNKCVVLSLEELFTRIESGASIPDNAVVITLDGGWVDNFIYAAPIIRRYGIPVTMFLPTAFIGTLNYPWQDKVLIALMAMQTISGKFLAFEFFTDDDLALLEEVSPDGTITPDLAARVISILGRHSPAERNVALKSLGLIMHTFKVDLPSDPAFMSWEEARALEDFKISFGTLTHGNIPFTELYEDLFPTQIDESIALLKKNLKNPSSIFAFPEGVLTPQGMMALHERGITRAVGIAGIRAPKEQYPPPLLVARLPICEGQSYATEVLACHVWLNRGAEV